MATTYCLEQAILGPRKSVPITEDEFLALKQARSTLSEALDFEQRYELLVASFISMEMAFTEIGLRSTIERSWDYPTVARVLQESNRHLANILTAARSYIDQVVQDFKPIALAPSFEDAAKAMLSKQYDGSLEYRFMEALRNHTQHHSFPATSFNGNELNDDANDWVESLRVTAKREELFANRKFKRKYLDDLPEVIDLRITSREYVRRIGEVHIALRELVNPDVQAARKTIEQSIDAYGADGHPTLGLCARSEGDVGERVSVFTDWDDVRVKLARKNDRPPDLWPRPRGYDVTSEDIRGARLARGQSVKDAARKVGIPPLQWERYEAGLRIPFCIHTLHLLQAGEHATHTLEPRMRPSERGA
ncbi:helix-turn-helix transcriptional regulator [Variovorax sp. YR216]|uniref:helix-turn-helix domain-containing protein n=1 Tax=Variovorax sp. YR216 TaxID=1882828 RepID=UPI00089CE602|nr:helix-turn-helix transcriptional regulator [Variovorax sp. YR216]SEA87033.1 hypothetical protein SAMN05444680_10465 [Variovorax sp. YR216]